MLVGRGRMCRANKRAAMEGTTPLQTNRSKDNIVVLAIVMGSAELDAATEMTGSQSSTPRECTRGAMEGSAPVPTAAQKHDELNAAIAEKPKLKGRNS